MVTPDVQTQRDRLLVSVVQGTSAQEQLVLVSNARVARTTDNFVKDGNSLRSGSFAGKARAGALLVHVFAL